MYTTKFSIQKHTQKNKNNKSHLDLRVLNKKGNTTYSWALPKNKFPKKSNRVLAIRTPDHPVSYMYFEGELDNGDKVSVYDRGKCKVLVDRPNLFIIYFRGKKIKGSYNFIKMQSSKKDDKWLITKSKNNE